MAPEIPFDESFAKTFDQTRPLDVASCQKVFQPVLGDLPNDAAILDVGCGTGRLLACIAPIVVGASLVGIDTSAAMLAVARKKTVLRGAVLHQLSLFQYEQTYPGKRFDLVICHWLFHCIQPWQAAVLAVIRLVKPGGKLVWMHEDGTLYQALDAEPHSRAQDDLEKVFDDYYNLVFQKLLSANTEHGNPMERFIPHGRAGTPVKNTDELGRFLKHCGWQYNQSNNVIEEWHVNHRDIQWLLSAVLKPRVFTNLRAIPTGVHSESIAHLERTHRAQGGVDPKKRKVQMSFSAFLVRAEQSKVAAIYDTAERNILQVSREMRSFGLFYRASDHHSLGAEEHSIKTLIRPFLASLLDGNLSTEWKAFWKAEKPQPANEPIWAWIRLWAGDRSFDEWKQSEIYRYLANGTWNDDVLRCYFDSITFLGIARRGIFGFEPAAFTISGREDFLVERHELKTGETANGPSSGRFVLRIEAPKWLFDHDRCSYFPQNDWNDFKPDEWRKAKEERMAFLRKTHDPDDINTRVKHVLQKLSIDLDRLLARKHFSTGEGFENAFALLKGIRLFPGEAFYLFSVPRYQGDVGGAMTLAFERPLTDRQISTLQSVTELLLLLPAVTESVHRITHPTP